MIKYIKNKINKIKKNIQIYLSWKKRELECSKTKLNEKIYIPVDNIGVDVFKNVEWFKTAFGFWLPYFYIYMENEKYLLEPYKEFSTNDYQTIKVNQFLNVKN